MNGWYLDGGAFKTSDFAFDTGIVTAPSVMVSEPGFAILIVPFSSYSTWSGRQEAWRKARAIKAERSSRFDTRDSRSLLQRGAQPFAVEAAYHFFAEDRDWALD